MDLFFEKYDKNVSCCGGDQAFSEPEKSQALIKDIIETAYDDGDDMIVAPCPVCQMTLKSVSTGSMPNTKPGIL